MVFTEDGHEIAGTESCQHLLCRKLVLQQCSEQDCVRLTLPQLEHLEVTLCNDLHALCLECPQLVTCSISECSSLWQVISALHLLNLTEVVSWFVSWFAERCRAVWTFCSLPAWLVYRMSDGYGTTVSTHRPLSRLGLWTCSCC